MQYIDSAMVGALGARASAAIGLVASATWLFNGVIYALSAGFSVQVAHHIGGGREREARSVVKHGFICAVVISGILSAVGVIISPYLPGMLGGEEEILHDSSMYFLTYALMIVFSQINSLSASFLQCCGDMVTPSVLNAVMCMADVVFNAVFIPRYGVFGAGIGTALACAVVSIMMLFCCLVRSPQLRVRREAHIPFDGEILRRAAKIGMPLAVQEIAMNGAMVVSTSIIAPLGSIAIAAHSFAITAESICYMPGYGIGSAATTLVGRSIGAGDFTTAKRYGNISWIMGAVMMGITGGIMMFACPFVFELLTPDAAVRSLGVEVLRIALWAEPLFGVSIVAAGALRGTGDTFVPSILNLVSIWGVRLGLAVLLVGRLGLRGMWIAMAVELCVRGMLMLFRQFTSKYYIKKEPCEIESKTN